MHSTCSILYAVVHTLKWSTKQKFHLNFGKTLFIRFDCNWPQNSLWCTAQYKKLAYLVFMISLSTKWHNKRDNLSRGYRDRAPRHWISGTPVFEVLSARAIMPASWFSPIKKVWICMPNSRRSHVRVIGCTRAVPSSWSGPTRCIPGHC